MTRRSLALGLLAAGFVGCGPPDGSHERLTGIVRATSVEVRAPVAGLLVEFAADQGDSVTSGQVLAQLDPAAIQAEIKTLENRIAAPLEVPSRLAAAGR